MRCRWELAKFRWRYIARFPKYYALFSFLAIIILGYVRIPDNDVARIVTLVLALFFIFSLILSMATIAQAARAVSKEHRAELNAIRREYGVEEK